MVSICLNMIVKNESLVIQRILNSVIDLIDYYVIVDTGSTDNTIECIKEFFKDKNIKGEIHEEKFIDFGYNRTHAVKLAKDKCDYILFMDADHILKYDTTFTKEQLIDYDEINISLKTGDLCYYLIRFLKGNMNIESIGSTHEYYKYEPNRNKKLFLKNIWIEDKCDGGCRNEKFTRDEQLLKEEIKTKKNSRNLFYLAETLKNSRKYKEAIKVYLESLQIKGWNEEKWYSLAMIAKCYIELNDEVNALFWTMEAYNFNNDRIENLYNLAVYYLQKRKKKLFLVMSDLALDKKKTNSQLFIEKDVYDFLFDYNRVLVYYYENRNAEKIINENLNKFNIPDMYYNNFYDNLPFYSKEITYYIDIDVTENNNIYNKVELSLINYNNKNYSISSLNPLSIIDDNFNIVKTDNSINLSKYNFCTNSINYQDKIIFLVELSYKKYNLYKFVILNNDFTINNITDSFFFKKSINSFIYHVECILDTQNIKLYLNLQHNISLIYKTKNFNKYISKYIRC